MYYKTVKQKTVVNFIIIYQIKISKQIICRWVDRLHANKLHALSRKLTLSLRNVNWADTEGG